MRKTQLDNTTLYESYRKYYLLLFLFWPFLTFLIALRNYSQPEARRVVYLFLVYYGFTFVLGWDFMDSLGYSLELKEVASLPFGELFRIIGRLYSQADSMDIYQPLVTFVVSRFTTDHRVLFGVVAILFGYVYLKSVGLLYNLYRQDPGWNAFIHLVFFIVILPISAINGVRMWTAAWIFFYGAIHVVLYRDPRYLLLALASSLVHWSFMTANVILIIYYLAGNRNFIYLPIVIVSFLIPKFITPFYQFISYRMGGAIQGRYQGYTSEGYVLERQDAYEHSGWFIQFGNVSVFYYLIIALLIIQIAYRRVMQEKHEKNLFSFLLLFLAFVNFGLPIPTFGSRFQILFFLFATFYLVLFFLKMPGDRVNILSWIGLAPMLIYAAITFRIGSDTISAWIFGPVFGLPWFIPELSLADILFH